MKEMLILTIALIVGLSFLGCESNSTNSNSDSVDQIAIVWAEYETEYWDEIADTLIDSPATFVMGVVFADPLPSFEYYKAGGKTYSGENSYEYFPGYIGFGVQTDWENYEPVTTNLDPLDIEVKTSVGKINGSIVLPDTIEILTLSEYDTLQINEPFTISWSGSNADFYSVYCDYDWIDEDGHWHDEDLDRFIIGNSITYPGSVFSHNGDIDYIRVQPMNGPFPEADAEGNMVGNGSGFLYYETESVRYDEEIVVGSGLYGGMAKMSLKKPSEKEIRTLIRQKIENFIVGN